MKRLAAIVFAIILLVVGCGNTDKENTEVVSEDIVISTDNAIYYTKNTSYSVGNNFLVFKTADRSNAFRYYINDAGIFKDTGISGMRGNLHTFIYIDITIENVSRDTLTPGDIKIFKDGVEITNDTIPFSGNTLNMTSIEPGECIKGTIYKICDDYYKYKNITARIYNAEIILNPR